MRFYHGSTVDILNIDLAKSKPNKDFGKAFYLSDDRQQALEMAQFRAEFEDTTPVVNVYEFDESALSKLKSLVFCQPTEEWVDFVHQNRTVKGFHHDYDIVYGPVANDRVYAAFALYEGGVLSKQELIRELRTYKLVDQYLFHTSQALQYLSFVEAKEVIL